MIGQTLGHYQIVQQLGAGGMGIVYRARDTRLERDVAIKVIRPEHCNPTMEAAFLREARLESSLNHPGIITVYDILTHGDLECIVMEYVPGKPLNKLIPEKGFTVQRAVELALLIGDALSAAHSTGIVHRDLRPLLDHSVQPQNPLLSYSVGIDSALRTTPPVVLCFPTLTDSQNMF